MAMLPNGNYERIVSAIQHKCVSGIWECIEYGWDMGKLHLKVEDGDPYEDGFSVKTEVKCCPFCKYEVATKSLV